MESEYDIVMLVLNDLSFDGRVRREAAALAECGWRVLVIGTQRADGTLADDEHLLGFRVHRVRYGRFGRSLARPWRWLRHGLQAVQVVRAVSHVRTRVVHAHDLPALLLAVMARWGRRRKPRLIYDSHELYLFLPRDMSAIGAILDRLTRPAWFALERCCIRQADAVITVSEPIARCLARWYRIPRPYVIQNCIDPAPAPQEQSPYLVHTGDLTNRGRCLTELVEAFARAPEEVGLVFLGEGEARDELEARAEDLGIRSRVKFAPPVAPEAVPEAICDARVALVLLRPDSWHIRATLPNKLFEAIAAGVPVVASGGFALRRMVERYRLGIVCDPDPDSIIDAIRRLLQPERQIEFRQAVSTAQKDLNWRAESERLRALYRELLP